MELEEPQHLCGPGLPQRTGEKPKRSQAFSCIGFRPPIGDNPVGQFRVHQIPKSSPQQQQVPLQSVLLSISPTLAQDSSTRA